MKRCLFHKETPTPIATRKEAAAYLAKVSEELARRAKKQDRGRAATKVVVEEMRRKRILREAREKGV